MYKRRFRRRPLVKKARAAKRRMAARRANTKYGNVRIVRKTVEQNVYNTAVAGTPAASASVVTIGAAYQTPAFAGSAYYNVPFSIDCALSDVINFTELTSLADKYKINWVKVKAFATSNTASAGGTSQLPSMLWIKDQDDAAVPASSTAGLNSIREKMGCNIRQFKQNGAPISMFFKPKLSREVYNAGGAAVGAEVTGPKFLDCAFPDIPHYGIKGFLQDVNLAATPTVYTQFKFDVTMSITLRDIQ